MNDAILRRVEQKLAQKTDRRNFLRGSALTAAALAGSVVFPAAVFGQEPQKPADKPADKPAEPRDGEPDGGKKPEEKKPEETAKGQPAKDPFKETKIDEDGRQYRLCPQCGFNMYRQDRTWTCENCGYSYQE